MSAPALQTVLAMKHDRLSFVQSGRVTTAGDISCGVFTSMAATATVHYGGILQHLAQPARQGQRKRKQLEGNHQPQCRRQVTGIFQQRIEEKQNQNLRQEIA